MNPESRFAEIVSALEGAGIPCLVMGGHAVRFYGLSRNITPASKFRMLLHANPTRERGECLGTRAGAWEDR